MHWYWHVRIYNKAGRYWHAQITTGRDLKEIDGIQDFYWTLTGCKMLLEGMSEQENSNLSGIQDAFAKLWSVSRPDSVASHCDGGGLSRPGRQR